MCFTMLAAFHCLPTRHPHMLRLQPAASTFASSVITITPVCQVRDSQVSKSFPLSLVLEAVQRVQGGRMPRERGRERSGETVQALTCTACIYLHCDCVYLHFVLHTTFSQYAFVRFFRSARTSCTPFDGSRPVRPSVRAKNLDHLYTGIYAL